MKLKHELWKDKGHEEYPSRLFALPALVATMLGNS
jgi:hypothetical protein